METIIKHPIFTSGRILPENSIHGLSHWRRVEKLGLMIAEENGADKEVISLFAYLHDARRENENTDPDHGKRAVILLDELIKADAVNMTSRQYEQLVQALSWHNAHDAKSADITVQTCWDADRLDLWRVGIIPDPNLMFTDYGKSEKMIKFSHELSNLEI